MRRINLPDDLQEDVLGLRELRKVPGAVLVVVFHAEHDVALGGVLERAADAVERAGDPLLAGHALISLPAQRPAMPRAKPYGQIDRGLLPLDLPAPLVGIRM